MVGGNQEITSLVNLPERRYYTINKDVYYQSRLSKIIDFVS